MSTEGIQLAEHDGLWEETPLYPEMAKMITSWVGVERIDQVLVYRRVPHGPIPVLAPGDCVDFQMEPQPEKVVFSGFERGFVLCEQEDQTLRIAHGAGRVSVISKDAIHRVMRNGLELWRRAKQG
jgi:hypothetical protein